MPFNLEIISPEKKFFIGQAKKLIIPSVTGQLTILTHHIPLFTPLTEGVIKVIDIKDNTHQIPIGKGMIEIQKDTVILLIETPEHTQKIDQLKVKKAEEKAEKFDKSSLNPKGVIPSAGAFRRSFIDLKEIKRRKRPLNFPSPTASLS